MEVVIGVEWRGGDEDCVPQKKRKKERMNREDYELKLEGIDAEAFSYDGEDDEGKRELKEWLLDVCKTLSPIEEGEEEGEEDEGKSVKTTSKKKKNKKRKIDDVYEERK